MEREMPRRCGRDRFGAWTQVRSGSFPLFRQAHVGFPMKGLDNPPGGLIIDCVTTFPAMAELLEAVQQRGYIAKIGCDGLLFPANVWVQRESNLARRWLCYSAVDSIIVVILYEKIAGANSSTSHAFSKHRLLSLSSSRRCRVQCGKSLTGLFRIFRWTF